jgi:hypothetical protein
MSITKYVAQSGRSKIDAVEVERESEQNVWVNGGRTAKRSSYKNYFDTWAEAHTFLIKRSESSLESARRMLVLAQGYHGNVTGMKEPS